MLKTCSNVLLLRTAYKNPRTCMSDNAILSNIMQQLCKGFHSFYNTVWFRHTKRSKVCAKLTDLSKVHVAADLSNIVIITVSSPNIDLAFVKFALCHKLRGLFLPDSSPIVLVVAKQSRTDSFICALQPAEHFSGKKGSNKRALVPLATPSGHREKCSRLAESI